MILHVYGLPLCTEQRVRFTFRNWTCMYVKGLVLLLIVPSVSACQRVCKN